MSIKYDVRFIRTAEDDLTEIIIYIAQDSSTAANKLLFHIESSLQKLSEYPYIGVIPQENIIAGAGFRYLVVDNYLVFYIVEDNTVFIHRIIHGARDYKRIL
jgi:toxin ParE1/3/4